MENMCYYYLPRIKLFYNLELLSNTEAIDIEYFFQRVLKSIRWSNEIMTMVLHSYRTQSFHFMKVIF